MEYRLAALPHSWASADVFILEDRIGRLYLFEPNGDRLERLPDQDANLVMQWYELSQSFTWHTRPEFGRMLRTTSPQRQDSIPAATRRSLQSPATPVGTLAHEPTDACLTHAEG